MANIRQRQYGFIQANRGVDLALQFCVIDEIACRKRLLDHHQVVFIQSSQNVCVRKRVGRVRINRQSNVGELRPNSFDK